MRRCVPRRGSPRRDWYLGIAIHTAPHTAIATRAFDAYEDMTIRVWLGGHAAARRRRRGDRSPARAGRQKSSVLILSRGHVTPQFDPRWGCLSSTGPEGCSPRISAFHSCQRRHLRPRYNVARKAEFERGRCISLELPVRSRCEAREAHFHSGLSASARVFLRGAGRI
jgi:hypothetical protein